MKIYTEVNYEWVNNKLVKTSAESFDYTGEVAECKGGGSAPAAPVTNNYYYEGEMGATGAIGPTGPAGPAGFAGSTGYTGAQGAVGDDGLPAFTTPATTTYGGAAALPTGATPPPQGATPGGIGGLRYVNPANLVTQEGVNQLAAPYNGGA